MPSPKQPSSLHRYRRFFNRRHAALAVGAVLIGSAAWSLAGKDSAAPAKDAKGAAPAGLPAASLTVGLATPQRVDLARSVAASGSVVARDELLIGSDASGVRLTEVLVEVGKSVRRGQLLARGDDTQLLAQLAQMDAQIRQARAELAQSEANLLRAERVKDSGLYSDEALQGRHTSAEAAAAKLELAQAQRRELEVRIAHTRVLAPADGVIARRTATAGAVMQPGMELFRLIRGGQLEWLAELPAHALAQVQPGAVARLRLDDGRVVESTVRLVAPTIDARSRNGTVHVLLPQGTPLKAGGHANGEIVVAHATALTLPEGVVFTRDGQAFVWVVDGDGVTHAQRIETGTRQRGMVEVTGGLPAGARVVAAGAGFVKEGERVRVSPQGQQPLQQAPRGQGASS